MKFKLIILLHMGIQCIMAGNAQIVQEVTLECEPVECFRKGEILFQELKFNEAKSYFENAANNGHVDSYYYLSLLLYNGYGLEVMDVKKSFEMANRGYNLGSVPCAHRVLSYLNEEICGLDDIEDTELLREEERHFSWFKNQFDLNGTPTFAYTIGEMYELGRGAREISLSSAKLWYKKGSELNDIQSMGALGRILLDEDNRESKQMGVYYTKKAAELNSPEAQYNMAIVYDMGKANVDQDFEEAFFWYEKAAQNGFFKAQYNLGFMYEIGEGVYRDIDRAIFWYKKSAEQGYHKAFAKLGSIYLFGDGVEKDYKKAKYWLELGVENKSADANLFMGDMYLEGLGVSQNYSEGIKWYTKAAKLDLVPAQYNLAVFYYNGKVVTQDLDQAFFWYEKAAEGGHASAQYAMGYFYVNGAIVSKDLQKGFSWYNLAAEQGNPDAQNNLGNMYEIGSGTNKNYSKAIYWYRKAARQGQSYAINNLNRLGE